MKNNILIGCLGVMAFLFSSCEKEGITMYEESPTVYFGEASRTYTFVENMDRITIGYDTVKIPLQISGSAINRNREVVMEVASNDTRTPQQTCSARERYRPMNTKADLSGHYSTVWTIRLSTG
ncbi:MAG: hypothetical protein ACLU30_20340 [Odoribacter splanchnicus]